MEASTNSTQLRIALCEDMKAESEILLRMIKESGLSVAVDCFFTGEAFLGVFKPGQYDLIFLDVYMGELSGVQTAEFIRATDTNVVIVFTTTSEDFTRESYRLNAYKYMLKPLNHRDVLDSLELAIIKRDRAQGATIQIVAEGDPITVPLADIVFIEASNRRSVFHMSDGTTHATTTTIDALEKLLTSPQFLRSHRAFIVNLDHVVDIEEDFVMDNGAHAYIRVKDYRKIKNAYDTYLFNSMRSSP